jgi:predicted transcriptional regulator
VPGDAEKVVGPLESAVLDVLWAARKPLAVRDVLDRLNERRRQPLAYTTVMTVMSRLADKGILDRERDGRGYLYAPAVRNVAEIAVRNVVREFGTAAVTHFVQEARADPKLLRRLQRLVQDER